jgi:hypothetical protein
MSSFPKAASPGVSRAVHLNRVLLSANLLAVRAELGEVLEVDASAAFAVSEHQIAHIYVNDPIAPAAFESCSSTPAEWRRFSMLRHGCSSLELLVGDLLAVASPDS